MFGAVLITIVFASIEPQESEEQEKGETKWKEYQLTKARTE